MKMLQIRNVPDDLHRSLKERAAREGTTMSELVLRELPRIAYKPSPEEVLARIRRRTPVGGPPAAELIRRDREERDERYELIRRDREERDERYER
jgi:plasmid stability protein